MLLHERHILQSQVLSHAIVDPIFGIVQVGVGGIDGYVILYGQPHAPLYVVGITHAFQPSEEEWMMCHNEVAAQINGLVDHSFRYVQTQ